jgi:hypothetical protein
VRSSSGPTRAFAPIPFYGCMLPPYPLQEIIGAPQKANQHGTPHPSTGAISIAPRTPPRAKAKTKTCWGGSCWISIAVGPVLWSTPNRALWVVGAIDLTQMTQEITLKPREALKTDFYQGSALRVDFGRCLAFDPGQCLLGSRYTAG